MYRDQVEALRLRLAGTDARLAEAHLEVDETRRALADAQRRLERLRDGVIEDDDLGTAELPRLLWTLQLVGAVGICAAVAAAVIFAQTYFPDAMISMQGVRNAVWVVENADGMTGLGGGTAILVLVAPWAVLPWASSIGLRRRRRWGWLLAIVSAVLWLPTPALPFGTYVLVRLFTARVRRVFFA